MKKINLKKLSQLSLEQKIDAFMQCNTSHQWCEKMATAPSFADIQSVHKAADTYWKESSEADLMEAFEGHPEIGDVSTLREKYRHTVEAAGYEQSGVNTADEDTLHALARGNKDYREKFGFIFIVCASGLSAHDMLERLQQRLPNSRQQELVNAAEEQRKITHLRLEKVFT